MDEARVEALDAKPLGVDLAAIAAVTSKAEFATLMAKTASNVGSSLFSLQRHADGKKPISAAVSRPRRARHARPRLLHGSGLQGQEGRRTKPS